jgi:hypothetical protein
MTVDQDGSDCKMGAARQHNAVEKLSVGIYASSMYNLYKRCV